MAHKITNDCIACGGCQSVCPCDAISEGDGKYEINPDLCVDCGACSAQCPLVQSKKSNHYILQAKIPAGIGGDFFCDFGFQARLYCFY